MTTVPNLSTCAPWAVPADITEVDPTQLPLQSHLADCLQAASDVLFQLTGKQFSGSCTDTVRPNARMLSRDHGRPISSPAWFTSGNGFGYYSGGSMLGYGYSRWGWYTCNQEEDPSGFMIPSIGLGVFPLTSIIEVKIDGAVVDPTTYRIDDNRNLVRVVNPAEVIDDTPPPGFGWPCTQRMDLPDTEVNTWSVTFTYGVPPPVSGKLAAAELGFQLYLGSTPPSQALGACRLPQRVTSITRQGMSAVVLDPLVFLDQGRTGLTRCDYFIESVNPGKLHRRATTMNVDIKRRVRRTGPVGG